jgi:hypothetical protein
LIRSKKLRDSARDEDCTFQIAGVCNNNPETMILAHLPNESHGMGIKSTDLSSAYCCANCHDVIDRRVTRVLNAEEMEWYMRRAQVRTLERFVDKGLVKIL